MIFRLHKHIHAHVKKYHRHYLWWFDVFWLILMTISLISSITQTFADVVGPNSPSIVNDNTTVGTIGWTTLGKVKASDDVYTTTILDDNEINMLIWIRQDATSTTSAIKRRKWKITLNERVSSDSWE